MTQHYVARTPEDLLALAPYLLGFHPDESVVLLTFGPPEGSFHARVDLPVSPQECEEVTAVLCAAVRANAATLTAVLVYSSDADRAERVCLRLVPALRLAGASVIDAIRADGRRWWSVLDDDPVPHPYDLSCHPFTAERVYHGQAALGSRAAVAASLVGNDPAEVRKVARAADRVAARLTKVSTFEAIDVAHRNAHWLHGRLAAAARDGELLGTEDAGRVLALVRLGDLRDVVWGVMCRQRAPRHVELWRDLVRRAPDQLVSRAASLLAFAAWLAGDGALAWCAVDRCPEHDPNDDLAHHVAGMLQHARPPATWTPVPVTELTALNGWQECAS